MKKITTLILGLIVCSATWSQVRLGVKGGLTLSNISAEATMNGQRDRENGDMIAGFHGGGFADIRFSESFHFRPELIVVRKGADLPAFIEGQNMKVKLRPTYLELPLNFVYYSTGRSGLGFYAGGGPALSVGIGGNIIVQGLKVDIYEQMMKRFDMGLNVIFGLDLKNGLNFSISGNTGLLNVSKTKNLENDATLKFRNTAGNFSIGYLFNRK